MEQQREAVCAALRQHTGLTSIVWRPSVEMLKEEGCPPAEQPEAVAAADMDAVTTAGAAAAADSASSGSGDGSDGGGAAPAPVVVTENGLKFLASPLGQKVGWAQNCSERPRCSVCLELQILRLPAGRAHACTIQSMSRSLATLLLFRPASMPTSATAAL